MKGLFTAILIFLSVSVFGQIAVYRSTAGVTSMDSRMGAYLNMFAPRYLDTTAANVQKGIDSCGAIIFTYTGNKMWKRSCNPKKWEEMGSTVTVDSTYSINLYGDGSAGSPILGDVVLSQQPNNSLQTLVDGLFAYNTIKTGVVSGGIVTWIANYDYHVSAANYYINGVLYSSPATDITLDPAHASLDRLDLFVVDINGDATVIDGVPSSNPAETMLDPETQLRLSVALVQAATTSPTVLQECAYLENVEWTSSVTDGSTLNAASTSNPFAGTKTIEATNARHGHTVELTRGSSFVPTDDHTVLRFYLRSKNGWQNKKLGIFFENAGVQVGSVVSVFEGTYGFNSQQTSAYQIIIIPLSDFGLNGNTSVTSLNFRLAIPSNQTLGYYIDNVCLQGATLTATGGVTYVGTGYGLSGGPITSIGTIVADSSLLTTRLWHQKSVDSLAALITAGGISGITADNGLTANTSTNVRLGGSLLASTTIAATSFPLIITGSSASDVLSVTNASTGRGIKSTSDGIAFWGISTNSAAGLFSSTNSTAVSMQSQATSGIATVAISATPSSTNSKQVVLQMSRGSSGAAAVGLSSSILTQIQNSVGLFSASEINTTLTNATAATHASKLEFGTASGGGAVVTKLEIAGNGQLKANLYGVNTFAGTPAYYLGVDASGNVVETTPSTANQWNGLFQGVSSNASGTTMTTGVVAYAFTGASPSTFTLPSHAANTNRAYFIKNRGTAVLTVSRAGSDNLFDGSVVTSIAVNPGSWAMLWADASYWNVHRTVVTTGLIPSASGDSGGSTGDISYDDNYIYVKTSAGWKRSALSSF